MDKNLIEQYKTEMLKMYGTARPVNSATPTPQTVSPPPVTVPDSDDTGNLVAIVTTLRSIYPLKNARVTVFTGSFDDMQVVATGTTDQSGRTEEFILKAPSKNISFNSSSTALPYASYNMQVSAEGYRDNIHLNIPVFSGVTSIQSSNMMLLETAGVDKGPQIFDESENYGLN